MIARSVLIAFLFHATLVAVSAEKMGSRRHELDEDIRSDYTRYRHLVSERKLSKKSSLESLDARSAGEGPDLVIETEEESSPSVDSSDEELPDLLLRANETDIIDFNTTDANETDVLDDFLVRLEEPVENTTTVYIKLTEDPTSCISFNTSMEVIDCDLAAEYALWEVVESEDPELIQVRHLASQLCLPENPESPDKEFNCWIDEDKQAIADTINGLVDCTSPYAAYVGFIDPANPSLLYNAICK